MSLFPSIFFIACTTGGLLLSGCDVDYSCKGKQFAENCMYNGNAGYCDDITGYCLLACSGPEGSCAGAGSGAACYWLTDNKYVCRGAGDSKSAGSSCDGKINDCGAKYWCLADMDGGAYCEVPCRDSNDCASNEGTTCSDIADGGGLLICVPLVP